MHYTSLFNVNPIFQNVTLTANCAAGTVRAALKLLYGKADEQYNDESND